MTGIFALYTKNQEKFKDKLPINLRGEGKKNRINQTQFCDNLYVQRSTNSKFINDKLFFQDDDCLIAIEGVILNSLELISHYKADSFFEAVKNMHKKKGDKFFNDFRGAFSCFFYEKKSDKLLVYVSPTAERQMFVFDFKGGFIFGSEIGYLIEFIKQNNFELNLSKPGAYQLLTLGYILEDQTLFDGVKRISPGFCAKIEDHKFFLEQYYRFNFIDKNNDSEDEIIDKIDVLFRKAVQIQFEKDKEYGYKHIALLSGGLDSRMTNWVANDLGYKNILNITFSQSNHWDEVTAKQIASDLSHEWIFKFLDNGVPFFTDINLIQDAIEMVGGSIFFGSLVGIDLFNVINFEKHGIFHSGNAGDAIIGCFNNSEKEVDLKTIENAGFGYTDKRLVDKAKELTTLKYHYGNCEEFTHINRVFNCTMGSMPIYQEHGENLSPFMNLDFMEYAFSIPYKYRKNHYIYYEWVKKKYPKAGLYPHTRLRGGTIFNPKLKRNKFLVELGRILKQVQTRKMYDKFCGKFIHNSFEDVYIKKNQLNRDAFDMNPFDYWYKTNKNIPELMKKMFDDNIDVLDFDRDLKNDVIESFNSSKARYKTSSLTLLSICKKVFQNN